MFVGHIPRNSWFYVVSWCSNSVAWCWYSYVVLSWSSHLFVDDLSCSCCFLSSCPLNRNDHEVTATTAPDATPKIEHAWNNHLPIHSQGLVICNTVYTFQASIFMLVCTQGPEIVIECTNNYCSGPSANLETTWYFRSHSATSCEHLLSHVETWRVAFRSVHSVLDSMKDLNRPTI